MYIIKKDGAVIFPVYAERQGVEKNYWSRSILEVAFQSRQKWWGMSNIWAENDGVMSMRIGKKEPKVRNSTFTYFIDKKLPSLFDTNDKDLIDYDEVEALALEHKPKMIIAGASAYPRTIDWKKFREIADKVGAYFLVDMAHYSGLVAGKQYPNPIEHAHVVTSTTHKTLRGARSAMILTNHEDLYKKINSAVFPGLQGGPLMHVIAARAVCFGEALKPEFEEYIKNVIASAKVMAKTLVDRGFRIVTGGTDSHIVWLDLTPKGLTGDKAEKILEEVGLACNKNAIPYDPNPPKITSGLRFGTAAATTRGFNQKDFEQVGNMIADILDSLLLEENERNVVFNKTRKDVIELCKKYPIYSEAF